jgi:hypothetical protein
MTRDEEVVTFACEQLLRDELARIVAALEELASDETDEVARILADLEHDLTAAVSS